MLKFGHGIDGLLPGVVNETRQKFLALLADPSIGRIVIEYKDRSTRFGFRDIQTLLKTYGRTTEVMNHVENSTEELLADLTSSVYAFCARLYGQCRTKHETKELSSNYRLKYKAMTQSKATDSGAASRCGNRA
jgi:predicted site-specific integrase-resolvase